MSITVFTYGDPSKARRDAIATDLLDMIRGAAVARAARPYRPPITVLGVSSGEGRWGDETEHCGTIVVSGLSLAVARTYASVTAACHDQDAVGVVHDEEGRTLAVPSTVHQLFTADEVWS